MNPVGYFTFSLHVDSTTRKCTLVSHFDLFSNSLHRKIPENKFAVLGKGTHFATTCADKEKSERVF